MEDFLSGRVAGSDLGTRKMTLEDEEEEDFPNLGSAWLCPVLMGDRKQQIWELILENTSEHSPFHHCTGCNPFGHVTPFLGYCVRPYARMEAGRRSQEELSLPLPLPLLWTPPSECAFVSRGLGTASG